MNRFVEQFNEVLSDIHTQSAIHGILWGGLIALLGGSDELLKFLMVLMVTEYLASMYISLRHLKHITKGDIFINITQKVGMLWIIILGVFIDGTLRIDGQLLSTRNMLLSFFIGYEGLTILENCDIIGIRVPKKLRDYFITLRSGGGDK